MISSISIFFLVAFYFYFKQYYEKLIAAKCTGTAEIVVLITKLKRKLMIFPAGIIAIVLLYVVSYVLIKRYPDVDSVKSSRRVVDIVAAFLCLAIFYMDKRELDTKLNVKKGTKPKNDADEHRLDKPDAGI